MPLPRNNSSTTTVLPPWFDFPDFVSEKPTNERRLDVAAAVMVVEEAVACGGADEVIHQARHWQEKYPQMIHLLSLPIVAYYYYYYYYLDA